MDFWVSDDLAAHREAAREWVAANAKREWIDEQQRTGLYQTMELHRKMADDGILGAGWPKEYGGSDVDPQFAAAVYEELIHIGFHLDGWATTNMVLRTIEQAGTEEQKREYIGGGMRGEVMIALGYSEPDSGSDVAAAKTTAIRDGSEWRITGQKMFTSTAQVCSHVFVLARTNPDVPKHQGLSLFMVPTSDPGYDCQPIHTLGGQTTNATFYDEVRVGDDALIGDADQGWSVMGVALVFERGVGSPTGGLEQSLAAELTEWALATKRDDGSTALDDPLVAERIGRIHIDEEVSALLGHWANWKAREDPLSTVYGATRKLFSAEAQIRNTNAALDALGAEGVLQVDAPDAPGGGLFERDFRQAQVKTIYGGSSEIMRDIIAQRRLALPRNRPAS